MLCDRYNSLLRRVRTTEVGGFLRIPSKGEAALILHCIVTKPALVMFHTLVVLDMQISLVNHHHQDIKRTQQFATVDVVLVKICI